MTTSDQRTERRDHQPGPPVAEAALRGYDERASRIGRLADATPAEAWDRPSPCEGWSARDVVAHLIETQRQFLARQGLVDAADPVGAGAAPADPAAAWRAHVARVRAVVDEETAARRYEGFFGPTTVGATLTGFYGWDMIVHRWDLAVALGADAALDPSELDAVEAELDTFGEALYGPGICARPVPVPEGADRQTRLLARLGRRALR